MRRIGLREGVIVTAVFAFGWTVRWWHLGTPSLWWDELVHLSFASGPDPWWVFRRVQRGVPPGGGNAGSVPFDYLLLHAWTWLVQRPPPEQLEQYYRLPAYVWSGAALVAFWAYCRSAFGRTVALTATLLLALSVPHVLYAAEARFYSLLVFVSVLNLAAFTAVMRAPERPGPWIAYGLVNVVFFLTGFVSLLVLPWQFAALVVRAVTAGDPAARRRRLGWIAGTAATLAATLAWYYGAIDLGARGIRPGWALLRTGALTEQALAFVTLGDPRQRMLLLVGVLVAPLACRRLRPALLPVVLTVLVITLASMPLLVPLLRWKRYYFHPRHVLFLLPALELLTALGLVGAIAFLASWLPAGRGRRALVAAVAVGAVCWLRLPAVGDFLARPHVYFQRTKTERDFRSFARDLRVRTATYRPGEKFLLVVDRIGPGNLANPTLARYLRWYGLESRVVLLSATDFPRMLERLRNGCGGPCRGRPGAEVARALQLGPPFEADPMKLRLLALGDAFGAWPGTARDTALVVYPGFRQPPDLFDTTIRSYTGLYLLEPL